MNRIKELRESKGMTQIRLSIELSVTQETVSAYENDKHFPSIQSLIKMSEIFNASCDYILGLSDVRSVYHGGSFNEDELSLIADFRSLSPTDRNLVKAYMQGVIDKKQK